MKLDLILKYIENDFNSNLNEIEKHNNSYFIYNSKISNNHFYLSYGFEKNFLTGNFNLLIDGILIKEPFKNLGMGSKIIYNLILLSQENNLSKIIVPKAYNLDFWENKMGFKKSNILPFFISPKYELNLK